MLTDGTGLGTAALSWLQEPPGPCERFRGLWHHPGAGLCLSVDGLRTRLSSLPAHRISAATCKLPRGLAPKCSKTAPAVPAPQLPGGATQHHWLWLTPAAKVERVSGAGPRTQARSVRVHGNRSDSPSAALPELAWQYISHRDPAIRYSGDCWVRQGLDCWPQDQSFTARGGEAAELDFEGSGVRALPPRLEETGFKGCTSIEALAVLLARASPSKLLPSSFVMP